MKKPIDLKIKKKEKYKPNDDLCFTLKKKNMPKTQTKKLNDKDIFIIGGKKTKTKTKTKY